MPRPTENLELTHVTDHPRAETDPSAGQTPSLSRPDDVGDELTHGELTGQGLAPTDGGPAAWRLLVAAFVFETLLWGNGSSHLWAQSMKANWI